MKIVDLTHTIHPNMPVFPGTEPPTIDKTNTLEKDGFREALLSMYSHTGTHIDAPAHMFKDGAYLDDLNVNHFIGKATILDFSEISSKTIELDSLMQYEDKIKNVDFVIIKIGWAQHWGDDLYFKDFPALSSEAAKWLSSFTLKGLGIDAISIDSIDSTTFDVHKILLSNNIISIENLTNLSAIESEYFTLSVMPLKTERADGSPVRAFAIDNIV